MFLFYIQQKNTPERVTIITSYIILYSCSEGRHYQRRLTRGSVLILPDCRKLIIAELR
jgi:hypothetical protein